MKEENPSFDLTKCVLTLKLWDWSQSQSVLNQTLQWQRYNCPKTASHAACRDFGHRAQREAATPTASVVGNHVISGGLARDTVGTKGTFTFHFSKSRKWRTRDWGDCRRSISMSFGLNFNRCAAAVLEQR